MLCTQNISNRYEKYFMKGVQSASIFLLRTQRKTKQLTCSWYQKNESTNSPIHESKVLHKGQRAFYNPFLMVYYFLFFKF